MNFFKTLVITATLFISCNHLFAQKKEDTAGTEKNWYIKDAFPVSETQSLAIWEHKKAEYGIVMVNNTGVIEWEMPFKGCILGISKYKDHFLVFYTERGEWSKEIGTYKKIKKINAAILDIKSHKIIEDKVIYNGTKYVALDFQNDPAGNFSQLLVRQTTPTGYKETEVLTLISLNADGSVANKEIKSMAIGGAYIGSSVGKDGSFFISSIQNWSSIVVEKFSHEGTLISKLESPLATRKDPDYITIMRTDAGTNNAVTITIKALNNDKDYAFSHFLFNFDNNQVAAVNEAPLTKKSSPYRFQSYSDLKPIDILFTNDKIIVIREVRYYEISGSGSTFKMLLSSRNAIVSVFDKQMKLQREIILNKATSSYSSIDIGLSFHINKNKLYVLSGENAEFGKYDNFCYNVNLNEGTYERKKIGVNKSSGSTSISTVSTIWFNNELIMTNLHIGGFGGRVKSYSSVLERIGFDAL